MNFFVTVFAKLHKSILKGKGTLKLDVNDFADLQYFRGYSKYQNIDVTVQNRWDSRVVNVSFTYRFNKGHNRPATP